MKRSSGVLLAALLLAACREERAAPVHSAPAAVAPAPAVVPSRPKEPDDPRVKCPEGTTQKRAITEPLKILNIWCEDADGYSHGHERKWYANGRLGWEREYVHGKLDGSARGWYRDGTREHEYAFQNGQMHGKAFGWHPNGRMSDASEWRDGKLLWMKRWDEKGRRLPPPPDFKLEP